MKGKAKKLLSVLLGAVMIIGRALPVCADTGADDRPAADTAESHITYSTGGMLPDIKEISPEEAKALSERIAADYEGVISPVSYLSLYGEQHNRYFYNQLSDDEKAFYDGLYEKAWELAGSDTDLTTANLPGVSYNASTLDKNDLSKVAQIFFSENPAFFFLTNGGTMSWSGSDGTYFCTIIDDFKSHKKRDEYKTLIDTAADAIIDAAEKKSTNREKVDYIANALVDMITYELNCEYNQTIASSLGNKVTVCSGYALAMVYLCNAVGVECIELVSETHAWNIVNIGDGDGWEYIDVTWMDQGTNPIWEKWRSIESYEALQELDPGGDHRLKARIYKGMTIPGKEDSQTGFDDEATHTGTVIWAAGAKTYKTAQLTASRLTEASEWITVGKNGKTKTNKGKLAWLVAATLTAPKYDKNHKLTTKTDKTAATVSNKGVVTAVSGGATGEKTAYVFVTDSGSLTSESFEVTVKNAANTVYCTSDESINDKKYSLKNLNLDAQSSKTVYIKAIAKGKGESVSPDCTYTVTADPKQNAGGYITVGKAAANANGNVCFTVTAVKSNGNKPAKVKVTVTNDQSGKKYSFTVNVGSPVIGVTPTTTDDAAALQEKNGTACIELKLSVMPDCTDTTWKLKVLASTSEPTVDSKNKVTFVKSKTLTAALKNNVITLKSPKGTKDKQGIYLQANDPTTKKVCIIKVAYIDDDGKLVMYKTPESSGGDSDENEGSESENA